MFLWLGLAVPSNWVMSVFGVPSTAQVDTDKNRLPVLDNPISKKVRGVIANLSSSRHRTMRVSALVISLILIFSFTSITKCGNKARPTE